MSSFNEFSKSRNFGDMNKSGSKNKTSEMAKNRVDPNSGNVRDEKDDGMDRERSSRSHQENSNPRNRERPVNNER